MWWRRKKQQKKKQVRIVLFSELRPRVASNDNCFWASLLGRANPFNAATKMLRLREQYLSEPCLLIEDRLRLIESCDVFLDLYQAIHVKKDLGMVESLVPKLIRHVPELMVRCPIREYRPTAQQLEDVRNWYMLDETD